MSTHDQPGAPAPDRDDALRRGWRVASNEQPSPRLDAAILAAARESVAGRRSASGRPRAANWLAPWQGLAAAAAVAGLAFVLVPMLPRTPTPTYPVERRQAAPVAAERAAPASTTTGSMVGSAASASAATESATESAAAPPAAARAATEAATSASMSVDAAAESSEAFETAGAGHAAAAKSRAVDQADAGESRMPSSPQRRSGSGAAAPPDPATWAAEIAAAHAGGDLATAERELRAFRAAWPEADTWLAPELRDWARTVE